MTISNSHVLNCRVNAPGLWPLTISLGANPSILLQLGGGLYSIESETTEIRTRADVVSPKSGRLSPVLRGSITTSLAGSVSRFGASNSAGPAHGERPVVNGRAVRGVKSSSLGSTPPSGINSRAPSERVAA